jgi:hypothetical protein
MELTKRELFAAYAMQGLLMQHIKYKKDNYNVTNGEIMQPVYRSGFISTKDEGDDNAFLAKDAVAIADELIEALQHKK